MIPYDDLVAALQAWRARQGLPTSATAPAPGSGPTPVATAPTPGSGPRPGVPRSNPPAPPPGRTPMPLAAPEESIDEHMEVLDEQHYENEGDDFAMSFGGGGQHDDDSSTQIGGPPDRPSETTDPRGGGPHRDDW